MKKAKKEKKERKEKPKDPEIIRALQAAEAARVEVDYDQENSCWFGLNCFANAKPEEEKETIEKGSLLYRLHDLVTVQRSKEDLLAAAARIGKRIVELRGALEGAVAARSANSHSRQALKKISHSDVMAVGFGGRATVISNYSLYRQTLEDTHVVRKTPSDMLDPVEWEAKKALILS